LGSGQKEIERVADEGFQVFAVDYGVEEAVLEQKF